MLEIKILGSGCAKCNLLEELVKKSVSNLSLEAEIQKVTDPLSIIDYGVLSTPALVVNNQLLVSGRVPSLEEIKQYLSQPKDI
jgi:small redox-active disulfide protein 2